MTEAIWVALIAGVPGVLTAIVQLRTRGEVRATKAIAQRAAASAAVAEHEVRPNSGASLADGVSRMETQMQRLERDVKTIGKDIGGMREEIRTEREERRDVEHRLDRHLADVPAILADHAEKIRATCPAWQQGVPPQPNTREKP